MINWLLFYSQPIPLHTQYFCYQSIDYKLTAMRKSSSERPADTLKHLTLKTHVTQKRTHHTRTSSDDKSDPLVTPRNGRNKKIEAKIHSKTERTEQSPLDKSLSPYAAVAHVQSRSPKFAVYRSPPKKATQKKSHLRQKGKKKSGRMSKKHDAKPSKARQVSPQQAYKHFIMQQMGQRPVTEQLFERRITERSQQQSSELVAIKQENREMGLSRQSLLRRKIELRYRKELETFSKEELNFYCSVVLIQRWWRARQAQNIIKSYMAPPHKERSLQSTLPLSPHIDTPRLVIRPTTRHSESPKSRSKEEMCERQQKSLLKTPKIIQQEEMQSLILEQVPIKHASQAFENDTRDMIKIQKNTREDRLVSSFRDALLSKSLKYLPLKLQTTLSEDSLLHKLYSCISKHHPIKTKQSPTDEGSRLHQVQVQTQPNLYLHKQSELQSLKNLSQMTDQFIDALLIEACKETATIMSQRRAKIMPGMAFTSRHNRHFLNGLSKHLMKASLRTLLSRFNQSNPLLYLKVLRSDDCEDQQPPSICQPLLPSILFYEYEVKYERQNLHINIEHSKFANFLETIFKLHSYMLANCFEQGLQNLLRRRDNYPWSHKRVLSQLSIRQLEHQVDEIIEDIVDGAQIKLLNRAELTREEKVDQAKALEDLSQSTVPEDQDLLEYRLELSEKIEDQLLTEWLFELIQ